MSKLPAGELAALPSRSPVFPACAGVANADAATADATAAAAAAAGVAAAAAAAAVAAVTGAASEVTQHSEAGAAVAWVGDGAGAGAHPGGAATDDTGAATCGWLHRTERRWLLRCQHAAAAADRPDATAAEASPQEEAQTHGARGGARSMKAGYSVGLADPSCRTACPLPHFRPALHCCAWRGGAEQQG